MAEKDPIIRRIAQEIPQEDSADMLTKPLSLSDLTSLLLDVFRQQTSAITPSDLLRRYAENRFVRPAQLDVVASLERELTLLRLASASHYTPIELSPVTPLGTCSVIAPVSQNHILSAVRGAEVVSDATNVLALECATRRNKLGCR